MIAVYCQEKNPRISYSLDLVLKNLLGLDYELFTELDQFLSYKGAKISYGPVAIDGYHISSSSLLFENYIREIEPEFDFDSNHLILDKNEYFDIFAASFYLTSRYEEYLAFKADDHGRFPATESVLYKYQILKTPIINEWAIELKTALTDFYPNLLVKPRKFEYWSTIDIDQAYKYKHKGSKRTWGGLLRDLKNGNFKLVSERIKVLRNVIPDPFENFDWQIKIHEEKNTLVKYFIQVGEHGEFDKNTEVENIDFQNIIKQLDQEAEVGMHPSYHSNINTQKVSKEKGALQEVLGHLVENSRQHFLKCEFPSTFQRLNDLGIKEEHSLGYSTHFGFRAGIAAPFPFFDLKNNVETDMVFIPFCMMDITPLHYYEQTIQEAKIEITQMVDRVKKVGGLCVSLWHNESFSENGRWEGWRTVYEHLLNQSIKP